MILLIKGDYRMFRLGQTVEWSSVSEDDLNYYLHGWNDSHISGIWSNYLVLPKFVAVERVSV